MYCAVDKVNSTLICGLALFGGRMYISWNDKNSDVKWVGWGGKGSRPMSRRIMEEGMVFPGFVFTEI